MATTWAELLSDSAMLYIDDRRLQAEAAAAPAQFFRRMSLLVQVAIPMFDRPPEVVAYLTEKMELPEYEDSTWTSTDESLEEPTEVDTGFLGYEVFSCNIREVDGNGAVQLLPYPEAAYDSETGVVTFPKQDTVGTEYVLDFYKDGSFGVDLTASQKRILGLCVAVVWDTRFSRNWLNMQMKIHDKSFSTVNEGTYMTAATSRLEKNTGLLNEALWKYEQDCAYKNVVSNKRGIPPQLV